MLNQTEVESLQADGEIARLSPETLRKGLDEWGAFVKLPWAVQLRIEALVPGTTDKIRQRWIWAIESGRR